MSDSKETVKNFSDCDIAALGCKLICYACHGTFYDLGHIDPTCPYCQSVYSKTHKRRKKATLEEAVVADAEVVEELDVDEDSFIEEESF